MEKRTIANMHRCSASDYIHIPADDESYTGRTSGIENFSKFVFPGEAELGHTPKMRLSMRSASGELKANLIGINCICSLSMQTIYNNYHYCKVITRIQQTLFMQTNIKMKKKKIVANTNFSWPYIHILTNSNSHIVVGLFAFPWSFGKRIENYVLFVCICTLCGEHKYA